MSKLTNFSAIIFDMDGLVIESESTYVKAWQQTAQEMGYHFSDEFCLSMTGLHSGDVIQHLLTTHGLDFNLKKFYQLSGECWRAYVQQHGIQQKKGVLPLLELIEEYKIPFCLATNSPETNARECLVLADLDNKFNLIIARDHVEQGKPAPDIFLKAAKILNQPISQCLVLEDSAIGIEAANKAGAISVLIPSQRPVTDALLKSCEAMFNDLAEVAAFILKTPQK